MNIGIIGAGNIGSVLAQKLVALGHTVSIANSRGPSTLREVAKRTGARAVKVEEALEGADVVIVSIPQKNVPTLASVLRDLPANAVVIDTGNYAPSSRIHEPGDGLIDAIEKGETESGWVATSLGRPVVKVFNSITFFSLAGGGTPRGTPGRIALPVASDDARAKKVTMDLVDALGFDPVDAGSLADSWRQQPGTPVCCTDLDAAGVKKALGMADRAKSPALRERSMDVMRALPAGTSPAEIIRLIRLTYGAPDSTG